MQGPSSFVILQAQQVLISANGVAGNGLFVYNPGTGKGNLIAAMVAVAGSDAFGNTVPAVFNIGVWSAAGTLMQHFGVDASGRVYLADTSGVTRVFMDNGTGGTDPRIVFFNAFGATILVVDPQRGGTFQYQDNNSATQGILIGAQVGKNTTDPVNGTTVTAGINVIDPVFGDVLRVVGANINFGLPSFTVQAIDTANQGSTNQGPFRSTAAPEQGVAGHVVQRWYGTSIDGTRAAGTVISLTDPPTRQTGELLEVQGTALVTFIKAFAPGSLTTEETWHTPTLAAGFAAGTPAPRFQFEAINGGRVRLAGQISLTANSVANATMFTLPAGYVPAIDQFFVVPNTLSGAVLGGSIVKVVSGSGAVQIVPTGTSGNNVRLDGIDFPLD